MARYEDLNEPQRELLDAAEKAMERAYNPYSGFYVGAALRTADGKIIPGANFENASYGLTVCAERAAIITANSMHGCRTFESIAIIARGKDFETDKVTPPCGSCRQMLYEMSQVGQRELEVIVSTTKKDKILVTTIKELLPLGFGPEDLGIAVRDFQ